MKKFSTLIVLSGLVLVSCGNSYEHVSITTSMFPHYDLVRQISATTDLTYSLIVPPGVEVHSYRPTPKQTAQIQNSKLFVYSSELIETWVAGMNFKDVTVINMHETLFGDLDHDHDEESHEHGVHYWTSPANFIEELDYLTTQMSSINEENTQIYELNANNYANNIQTVSDQFTSDIAGVFDPKIFFVGHNAMADFGEYFGIEIISLVEEIKPDADVTPLQLATLIDAVVASDTNYLFVEELAAPLFAATIKNELKNKHGREIEILELHGYHNVSLNDYDNGTTYLDLLTRNLNNLREVLL